MTQPKTEASRFGERLFKSVATSALALSAVVGGTFLSTSAQAATRSFPPVPPLPMVEGEFTLTSTFGPTTGTGTVELRQFGTINYIGDVDVDFDPDLHNNNIPGVFIYKLESNHGHFLAVLLDSVCVNPGCLVQKEVFEDAALTTPLIGAPLVSTNGSNTGYTPILKNVNTIWVRDTYSVDPTGILDNFSNSYQTPGPLPILGAGAAFGFSRKLRGRIKASRNA